MRAILNFNIYLQVGVNHGYDISIGISGVVDPLEDSENFNCTMRELHTLTAQKTERVCAWIGIT